jgi:RNA polymerase sigma factor (sigma-70 family)
MISLSLEVIKALQKGDTQAFQTFYDGYKDLLYLIIVSIVKHEENAKDLLQETLLTIYQKRHTLRDPLKLKSWVTLIAKNHALNYLKKKRELEWEESYDLLAVTPLDESRLFATWHHSLTDAENLIIAYKIVYEYTFEEIASLTNIPLTSVYKKYQAALTKLKKEYRS